MKQFTVLHVFPNYVEDWVNLISRYNISAGDLLADLSRFPSQLYVIAPSGKKENVTINILKPIDYWSNIRDWLVNFTDRTGLQNIFEVEGYGFWWTLNAQKFVPAITEMGNIFSWIDLLSAIRNQSQVGKIILHGKNDQLLPVMEQIFSGIEIIILNKKTEREKFPLLKQKKSRPVGLLFVRVLYGIFYLRLCRIHPPEIIFLTNTNLLRSNRVGRTNNYKDVYLGDIATALHNEGRQILMVEKFGTLASWKRFFSRSQTFFSDILYFISYPKLARIGLNRKISRRWQQRWLVIKNELIQFMEYQGVDISHQVLPLVESQFLEDAPSIEILTRIWRHLFKIWKPKLIFVNNGYGKAAIPAVIASKLESIATIELQHGVIGRNHYAYLVPRQITHKTVYPLCDFLMVWGQYFKSLLVKSEVFKDSQVVICGSPRIDGLLMKSTSQIYIRDELGIKDGIPIVLYTSNGFATDWMDEVLDGIQKTEEHVDIYWLIKLHPRECSDKMWMNKIKQRHIRNIQVIGGDYDIYTLLRTCDIHISFSSTTIIEAAVLGKPNLGLDIPGIVDPVGYEQANAFLPVATIDLGSTVKLLLTDSIFRENLVINQKKFALDWCLHDGNAVNRIVGFVNSILSS